MVMGPILSALVPQLHGQTVWWQGLAASAVGLAVGFGLLNTVAWLGTKAFKREAMGFGDVKLMGAIGAFLGWKAVLFTVFMSSLLGSISGLLLIAFGGVKLQSRIPFGPYISAAALIWVFWGQGLFDAYVRLMHQ
jgi:leader peptidase (prepilin peptidase)/N-methyltransferase